MKKLLCTFFLWAGLIASAHAQTEQDAKLIGGSGALHFDTEGPNKSTQFSFSPRLGYFVADNFALGVSIPMQYNFNEAYRMHAIGLTPFARGYFGASATKLLLEGRAGYNRMGITYEYNTVGREFSDSDGFFTFGFGAGLAHFVNEHVGLELVLNYNRAEVSSFRFDSAGLTGITFTLGLQVHLPGTN